MSNDKSTGQFACTKVGPVSSSIQGSVGISSFPIQSTRGSDGQFEMLWTLTSVGLAEQNVLLGVVTSASQAQAFLEHTARLCPRTRTLPLWDSIGSDTMVIPRSPACQLSHWKDSTGSPGPWHSDPARVLPVGMEGCELAPKEHFYHLFLCPLSSIWHPFLHMSPLGNVSIL